MDRRILFDDKNEINDIAIQRQPGIFYKRVNYFELRVKYYL